MSPWLQQYMPQQALAKFAHFMANNRTKWLKNWLISDFIQRYQVDLSDAVIQQPERFSCFNEFFTRALKPSARKIANIPNGFASPVDGEISQFGKVHDGKLLQAKQHWYSLPALMGGFESLASLFQDGEYITLYLSPKDYHRVHMPITGQLEQMIYVPGKLFSVNHKTTESVAGLFANNERVIAVFDTEIGKVAIILVGAMIVGSISTIWRGQITPPHRGHIHTWQYSKTADEGHYVHLNQGEEMGHFALGSTVILLTQKSRVSWADNISLGETVRLGQALTTD